jgi:hypothetical protein
VIRLCVALMACLAANPALAASPAPQRSAHLPLPVPPVPPGTPPANENAPVPDVAMRGPLDPESGVRVGPQVFRATLPDTDAGFSPGSRYQMNEERKPVQTPGIRITVPLQ